MYRRTCLSLLASGGIGAAAGCLSRTASNPDIETPPPGECDAAPPPHPSTSEGVPDPSSYPDQPARLEAAPVRTFLEGYETAYRRNSELAEFADAGQCLGYIDAYVTDTAVESTENGFTGEITTKGSHSGEPCPGKTGTPVPHADYAPESARYYVTARFLLRNGTAVECWE